MKCQWKECENEAAHRLFRPVDRTGHQGRTRRSSRRIWNENLMVCDTCLPAAQTEYPYRSFVHPNNYEANYNLGCWG